MLRAPDPPLTCRRTRCSRDGAPDLSVEHSGTLGRYRAAEEISGKAAAGTASTEDLRQAMVHYHALFADLLGEPVDSEPADQGSRPAVAAESTSQQFTASHQEEMVKSDPRLP